MPSFAQSNGSATGTTSRFQLPALDLKFGSLTEGTDIPPPLPSPIQEEPPPTVTKDVDAPPMTATTATQTSPDIMRNDVGLKHPADAVPVSPTSTKGPQSLRREALSPRPPSQSNASVNTNRQSKRSSGWFRRLRGSDASATDNKRSSRIFLAAPESPKPIAVAPIETSTGPPPPKIPEFRALGSKVDLSDDAGSLGADLFKDIK